MKIRKSLAFVLVVTVLTIVSTAIAFAGFVGFAGALPANSGDTEIRETTRSNPDTTYSYFEIGSFYIRSPFTSARAWTETPIGYNLSNPYNEVPGNEQGTGGAAISYYENRVPDTGETVVLNLDNPVYTSTQVYVDGYFDSH